MSEDVRVKGTLKPLLDCDSDYVDILQYLYREYSIDVLTDSSDMTKEQQFELFSDCLEEGDIANDYFLVDGKLLKIEDKEYYGNYHSTVTGSGLSGISFDVSYYSSCSLNEIIQEELKQRENRIITLNELSKLDQENGEYQ